MKAKNLFYVSFVALFLSLVIYCFIIFFGYRIERSFYYDLSSNIGANISLNRVSSNYFLSSYVQVLDKDYERSRGYPSTDSFLYLHNCGEENYVCSSSLFFSTPNSKDILAFGVWGNDSSLLAFLIFNFITLFAMFSSLLVLFGSMFFISISGSKK